MLDVDCSSPKEEWVICWCAPRWGGRRPNPLSRAYVFAVLIVIIIVPVNTPVATMLALLFLPSLLMLMLLLPAVTVLV